jgi:hypothetical protein
MKRISPKVASSTSRDLSSHLSFGFSDLSKSRKQNKNLVVASTSERFSFPILMPFLPRTSYPPRPSLSRLRVASSSMTTHLTVLTPYF